MTRPGNRMASKATRILIVDDHPVTREGLAQLIRHEADLMVCGGAESAAEALEKTRSTRPDLVLVDITLPGRSGLELIKDLQSLRPNLPALVISMHDELLFAERALRAGARGYIMKHEGGSKVIHAIRVVLGGEIYVSDGVSRRVLAGLSAAGHRALHSPIEQLSDREFEVFQLLGEGLPTRQIGRRLNLSSKTVETHRMNIKVKLGFNSSCELIAHAARWIESETNGANPGTRKRGTTSLENS
ncbi:MAG TPA: response regulator transcription factor [Chthoniobacteraceae bacterium]|nr:response regulator transcription factor [Chthoniobacteraceae bacterium]